MDATAEAGVDARVDADDNDANVGMDAGVDAAVDAGFDSGIDAGVDSGPPPRDVDYCLELPPLLGAVTFDGLVEPGLLPRTITPIGWTGPDVAPIDQPSAYAVAWRGDALYFYIAVTDATRIPPAPTADTWIGDGPEIYVDSDGLFPDAPAYEATGTMQFTIAAPDDDVTPVMRAQRWRDAARNGTWTSSQFRTFPTSTGYVTEALIVAADLDLPDWTLTTGARVGINVGVNVSVDSVISDTDGGAPIFPRLGQYFLRVSDQLDSCGGAPFCQPLAFCTPLLID
jgi:hypothetical protein